MHLKLHDTVRTTIDLPSHNIRKGSIGAIVSILEHPQLAYEVEFTDNAGRTIAELALLPEQVELVK